MERSQLPAEFLESTLTPPSIIMNPGPCYGDAVRHFALSEGIARTKKGRYFNMWIGGGDSPQAYMVLATSDDGMKTWSKPCMVIDSQDPGTPLRRSVLVGNIWIDPRGRLWVFFTYSIGSFDGRGGSWAMICNNPDAKKLSFSKPFRIWHGATLNKPTILKNGEWLLPVSLWDRGKINTDECRELYHELDYMRMANWFVSTDEGKTWQRRGGVKNPDPDFDEHMIVEKNDGTLWMLCRNAKGLVESFSSDAGHTWTEPKPSFIKSMNARFFLRRLASGRILIVKHGAIINETPGKRSHLSAFVSDDDGKTWSGGLLLDGRDSVTYPDGFQEDDGSIVITYDRDRGGEREILCARFTEDDVLNGKVTSQRGMLSHIVNKARGPWRQGWEWR
ncbi:MAG: exo-alpha-sialidase [Spirochaetes bacterium]|nr:exo-alpha-sialidase [Spirochaetota bacterium]